MSWAGVLLLCAAAYAMKAAGFLLGARASARPAESDDGEGSALELLVVPVIAALIVVQTVGGDEAVVVDARLPAIAVAALLVWRRVPLLAVVLAAGVTAAALRAL